MSKPIAEAKFYAMTAEAAVKTLQSDAGRGLSGSEAKKRLGVYGENRLQKGKKTSFAKKFMLQFGDFMVLILLIASAVSFAVSCMQGEANLADPLLILGIVIANAFVGTVQEAKAERALEALRTLSAPHADVLRDGKRAVISAEVLVPGDVVYIRAGDVVPADLRLLESMHLPAVETLGSCEVICSDKTGTLTQNKMTVVRCAGAAGELNGQDRDALLSAAALCTSVEGGEKLLGDPTETAIVAAVSDWERLQKQRVKAAEVPFTAERRRMTVVLRTEGGYRVITKGAPEAILPRCTYVLLNGKNVTLTPEMRAALSAKNRDMANDALRVLAAAEKRTEACPETDDAAESGLCFLGLIGLEDPPRPEAAEAVSECKRAGIRPVMITGDQPATASAIAGRLGIENKAVMTGAELESLSDDALLQTVQTCSVYARVSPAHKMRIIKAFRRLKLVTAMTGDGVNDAPALKAADIGCAMGKNGTEVAKNAADMVLTDDNFATIVSAVREGRTVYGNIRKTIHFLMSCNIGEILVVLVSFLLRTPTPLLPAQLLWVNLVTDSLPALALGSDPPQGDVMRRPPTARDSSAFSNGLGFAMAVEGMMIGALALLAFTVGRVFFDADPMQPAVGRTMAFAVLSLSQLVHSYNMRSTGPVLGRGMFKNRGLNVSFLICSAWMAGVVVFPQAAALFGSVPLTLTQWGIVAILALLPLPICEMQKRILSRTAKVKNMTSGVKKRVIFNK